MQGTFLKLYISETAKHGSKLVYEWVLETAQKMKIPGGSVFKTVAGYGRHGRMHEEHFFELAGELPLSIELFAEETAIDQLLQTIQGENISIFFVKLPASGGLTS